MVDLTKRGIAMISAVTEALKYRTPGKIPEEEEIMKKVINFVSTSEFKEYQFKMVSAVSEAIKIIQKDPSITDREVIDRVVKIISKVED